MITERSPVNPLRWVQGVFYGWWLVGMSAFVMTLGIVPLFQSAAAWFVVLRHHFSWSAGQLSWAFSLTRVESGLIGPLEGVLVDWLGPRRIVLIGMVILGVGFLLFSQVNELWHLFVAFIVMYLGSGLGTWLPLTTAINNWFNRRRTRAIAFAWGGYSSGAILLVPALVWAIDPDAERFGWRAVAAGFGVLVILLAFPISLLVRNRPEEYGQLPDGDTEVSAAAESDPTTDSKTAGGDGGYTLREAIQSRQFWFIGFGHACSSSATGTIAVHLGLMLDDRGLSLQTIAWVISLYALVVAVFTFCGGFAAERMPIRYAIASFSSIQSVAVVVLVLTHNAPMAFLFAVIMGIGYGVRNPLTTAVRGVYFGRRAFASIYGFSQIPLNIMAFSGPLFAGYMFDITGSYTLPFLTVGAINLIGVCLFLMLGEPVPLSPSHSTPKLSGR